jgi:hypothetical protein
MFQVFLYVVVLACCFYDRDKFFSGKVCVYILDIERSKFSFLIIWNVGKIIDELDSILDVEGMAMRYVFEVPSLVVLPGYMPEHSSSLLLVLWGLHVCEY